MKRFVVPALLVVAIPAGFVFGWRWVLAPLLGLMIWWWARATLRSFVGSQAAPAPSDPAPEPVTAKERTLYWCEDCGTEYLLMVRGSGKPPRHCGTSMHERTEVLN